MRYSYWPKGNASKNDPVTIERYLPEQLEKPVNDLLKCGYVEIKRGSYSVGDVGAEFRKTAILTSNLGSRDKKLLDINESVKHFVVMQKVGVCE